MKYLSLFLLASFLVNCSWSMRLGNNDTKKQDKLNFETILSKKANKYCSCHKQVALIRFYYKSAKVFCGNGTEIIIYVDDIIVKECNE